MYVQQIPVDSDSEEGSCTLEALTSAAFNLRKQADKEAKIQKMYRPRKPGWISWHDAKLTRLNVLKALEDQPRKQSSDKSMLVLEDALLISFHTVMPPDRVGVIRRLAYEDTLKKHTDGSWFIDVTAFKHKTSR